MREIISDSWIITLLAIYMMLLSSYAASTHPDIVKRKSLLRLLSIGIILACGGFLWNHLLAKT